jgi:hypothetical protein
VELRYDIAVTGMSQLRTVVRGVEQELLASSKRVHQRAGVKPGTKPGAVADETKRTARGVEQLDRQRSRALMADFSRQERARIRSERNVARAAEQLDKQRSRALMSQFQRNERAQAKSLRDRERTLRSVGGGAARSVRGALGGAAMIGGAALGVAGGFAAGEALRERVSIQQRASQLANQAGNPRLKGQLAQEATSVKGFTGEEALGGLEQFTNLTGNLPMARAALKDMSQLALATSTDLGELMAAAGNAFIPLSDQIKDPVKQLEALKEVMTVIAAQGAVGAVEIKDLATEMAGLAAVTNKFQGDPKDLIKTVGAMAQAARQRGGAESAPEAVTSVSRFTSDIVEHNKAFGAAGINVFSDKTKTKLRDPKEIMIDMLKKTKGSLPQITNLFGVRGERAVAGFSPLFAAAEAQNAKLPTGKRQKEGVAGEAAVRAEFKRLTDVQLGIKEVKERADSRLADPDLQFKEAMKDFNLAVSRELLPALTSLVPQFKAMLPNVAAAAHMFAKLISFLTENPFTGLGILVGGAIIKEIAIAGLGAKIGDAVTKAAAGAAPAAGTPAAGMLGAVGTGAQIGLTVATAIITANVANFEKGEADMTVSGQALNRVRASTDAEAVRKEVQEQRKKVDKLKPTGPIGGAIDAVFNSNKGVELKTQEGFLKEMEAKLQNLESFNDSVSKIESSAKSQEEAARLVKAAADKFHISMPEDPNRTSPIVKRG